jgi:hypothetical protein
MIAGGVFFFMPNRILRDWTTSEKIDNLSFESEVMFTRLIMKADDHGCFHANLKLLKAAIFPLKDVSTGMIKIYLQELCTNGIINTYEVEGREYLQIANFGQRLRTMNSKFPLPDSNMRSDVSNQPPETKRSRNEVETSEKGNSQKILVFGEASDKYFIINPATIHEPKYRVNSTGFKEFADKALLGTWFKREFLVDIFWEQWNGKMFNDIRHLSNVMLNINNPKKNGQSNN